MGKRIKEIDEYIKRAQPFAQPILERIRELVHKGCPEVEEKIKWGMPSFDYKGPFCSMASFKQHAVFGFWKGKLLNDPNNYLQERSAQGGDAMGNLGRITSLKDIPPGKVMLDFIKQAKKLNDDGIKAATRPKAVTPKELIIPDYFTQAVNKNKKAKNTFNAFSYSNKKDYVEWIVDAKTEATRNKRLKDAIEWMAEGKVRNWKYLKK